MILVDTSVLIDFLREVDNSQTGKLNEAIRRGTPFGINDYIYQELLQGTATEKDFNTLESYLSTQRFYSLLHGRESFESAARLYFRCRKNGLTIRSTVDFLIAQTAIENGLMLLHSDSDFTAMAKIVKELKIF